MPRIKERTLYKFDELSDEAKAHAIEKAREGTAYLDYEWWDGVFDDFEEIAKLIGITIDRKRGSKQPAIWFTGFASQGDGAQFEGEYRYKPGWRKALESFAPTSWKDSTGQWAYNERNAELHRLAEALQKVQARQFYQLVARIQQKGRYCHSTANSIEVWRADDNYRDVEECGDADDLRQALRELMDWLYQRLESLHDDLNSDSYITEYLVGNEFEFTEDGTQQ